MAQQDESKNQKKLTSLTLEQRYEILSYPSYFQATLTKAALQGESIKKVGEKLERDWASLT